MLDQQEVPEGTAGATPCVRGGTGGLKARRLRDLGAAAGVPPAKGKRPAARTSRAAPQAPAPDSSDEEAAARTAPLPVNSSDEEELAAKRKKAAAVLRPAPPQPKPKAKGKRKRC